MVAPRGAGSGARLQEARLMVTTMPAVNASGDGKANRDFMEFLCVACGAQNCEGIKSQNSIA
jgi:hypothetical protein